MSDTPLAEQYADLQQQRDAALLGIWVFLSTEVLFFGGLILAYCFYRYAYSAAFAEAARHTRIVIGTGNTAILLTSSFLVAWAVGVAKLGAGRVAGTLLWGAAALGVIFIALKGVEYYGEIGEGLFPGVNFSITGQHAGGARLFFTFYFIATGLHALHVAIGIVALIAIGARAHEGAYSARYNGPITVAALYWHFVDLVWIFLFALIYLPGRA
jgi:cytochrome c oxidase subunit 3